MKKKKGRPVGKKGSYNELSLQKENMLISDYPTMSNKSLMRKYSISRTQLRNIKKRRKLKSKNIGDLVKNGKSTIEELSGKSGIYAIACPSKPKAYIGSSKDIGCTILSHLSRLNSKTHINKELQKDWESNQFYYFLIKETPIDELLETEHNILNNLNIDDSCLYNVIPQEQDDDYSYLVDHLCNNKLCCNPLHLKDKSHSENIQYYHNTVTKSQKLMLSKLCLLYTSDAADE